MQEAPQKPEHNATLTTALDYYNMGFSIIPIEYGGKRPLVPWEKYQKERMSIEEVKDWFSQRVNIGIIGGRISGNLVIVDFDDMEIYEKASEGTDTTTLTHQTGKGIHKFFKTNTPVDSFRISELSIDVQGEGKYVVAPPSYHAGKKKYYVRISETTEPKELETDTFKDDFIASLEKTFKKNLSRQKDVIPIGRLLEGVGEGERDQSAIYVATWYRKQGFTAEETLQNMLDWNKLNKPPLSMGDVEQKVKSAYRPLEPYHFRYDEEPTRSEEKWLQEIQTILTSDDKNKAGKLYALFISWLLTHPNHEFLTLSDTEEIYHYTEGVYLPNGEQVVGSFAQGVLKKNGGVAYAKNNLISEIIGGVKRSTYTPRTDFNEDTRLICLNNGILNIETREFFKHTPDYKFTSKIPIDYDFKAKCPKFLKFLAEVLPDKKDQDTMQEVFGYCLLREYPIQKGIMLTGEGSNGKSVLLEVLGKMLGDDNVIAHSLQELEESRFARANLYGKLANIYPDLTDRALYGTGMFKLMTGGDKVTADKKFKDSVSFQNYAKLIFSANKLPETKDDSYAFYRRWLIIKFTQVFSEELGNKDPHLKKKLLTPEEMSGVLAWALEGLKRLMDNGQFTNQPPVSELKTAYIKGSDSLKAFVEECIDADSTGEISKDEFFGTYTAYCRERNLIPKDKQMVGRKLSELIYVESGNVRREEGRIRVWRGIKLREGVEQTVQVEHEPDPSKTDLKIIEYLDKENTCSSSTSSTQYKVMKYVPVFWGADDRLYGGWLPGLIVEIPKQEAEPLLAEAYVEMIE